MPSRRHTRYSPQLYCGLLDIAIERIVEVSYCLIVCCGVDYSR